MWEVYIKSYVSQVSKDGAMDHIYHVASNSTGGFLWYI